MPESLKKFFKVYPLPIFALILALVIYYSAFEFFNAQKNSNKLAITEEESMLKNDSNESTKIQIVQSEILSGEPQTSDSNATLAMTESTELNSTTPSTIPLEIPQQLPEEVSQSLVTTNSASLNIRKEPNTTSNVVGKLTPQITMLLLKEQDEWILLADKNTEKPIGWVFKRFARILEPTPAQTNNTQSPSTAPAVPTTRSNAQNTETPQTQAQSAQNAQQERFASRVPSLNIRQSPSTDAPIVGKLTPRDSVLIVESNDTWVKIQDPNSTAKSGWVVRRSLVMREDR